MKIENENSNEENQMNKFYNLDVSQVAFDGSENMNESLMMNEV